MAANTSVILLEVLLVGAYDFNMIIVFIFECECLRRGRRPLCSSTSGVTSFVVYSFQGAWFSYFGKAFSDALTSENVRADLGTTAMSPLVLLSPQNVNGNLLNNKFAKNIPLTLEHTVSLVSCVVKVSLSPIGSASAFEIIATSRRPPRVCAVISCTISLCFARSSPCK